MPTKREVEKAILGSAATAYTDDPMGYLRELEQSRLITGNEALYQPAVLEQMARFRIDMSEFYNGTILEWAQRWLPGRWRDWDRKVLSYNAALGEIELVPLSSIAAEEISWLWHPYIPLKKLTLMEGDPASGKTFLLLAIAAAITRGYALPDQGGRVGKPDASQAGNVVYITAEDGLADTIRPRADKVGADVSRIFVPPMPEAFSLAEPAALSKAMARFKPSMLVLDPIQAFLGGDMDMHRTNEVRPFMTTLLALAIEHNCAVVAIRHWTKAGGMKAKHRGQGSVDFSAAARSVLSVGESPEDETLRIMAQAKASLAALGASMVFSITDHGLEWCGTSTLTADELAAAQPTRHKEQRKDAMQWLKEYLHDGPQPSNTVIALAESAGISKRTLDRAKEHLRVLSTKEGGTWYWRLPSFGKWERYPGEESEETF